MLYPALVRKFSDIPIDKVYFATNCKNSQYKQPDKTIVAGNVKIQAERIIFTVLKFNPDLLATIAPALFMNNV